MKLAAGQNHRSLFIASSWLMTRLWIGVEISRLAIFRLRPKRVVYQLRRNRLLASPSKWVFERNKLFYLTVDDSEDRLIISEIVSIENN